jgi:hypothetical protein
MKYWQTSLFTDPDIVTELARVSPTHGISPYTMVTCAEVACRTPVPKTSLFLIETPGSGFRRFYLDYPDFDDWFRLERGGFVDTKVAGFSYVLDALH